MLLVTPSRIELLADGSSLLSRLLHCLFDHGPETSQEIDVVAAVVDGIARPDFVNDEIPGAASCAAFEGISIAILDSDIAAPGLWSTEKDKEEPNTMAGQRRTLSFTFRQYLPPPNAEDKVILSRTIQLPVANTLFHNGMTSTLFASRWLYRSTERLESKFVCTKKTSLLHQHINMEGGVFRPENPITRFSWGLPIQLMTTPRVVTDAMGNVVRQLRAGENTEEAIPASKELEDAISQSIKTMGSPQGPTAVWAVVTPKESHKDLKLFASETMPQLIEGGSRLHKVLSGGGGWGDKKGLLALDPDIDWRNCQEETDQAFANEQDFDLEKAQALSEIAKPGDVIAFFRQILPGWAYASSAAIVTPRSGLSIWRTNNIPLVRFGTLPLRIDAPMNEDKREEYPLGFEFIHVRNHFGILSERGLSLKIEVEDSADAAAQYSVLVKTKIDVPYSDITMSLNLPSSISNRKYIQRVKRIASSATSSTVTDIEAKVGKTDNKVAEPKNLLHHVKSREKIPLVMNREIEKHIDQSKLVQPLSGRVNGNEQGESSKTVLPSEGGSGVRNGTAQVDVKKPSELEEIQSPFEDILNALQLLTRAVKTFAALSRKSPPIPDKTKVQNRKINGPTPKTHKRSSANKPQQPPANEQQQPPQPQPQLQLQLQNTPVPIPKLLTISPSKVTPEEKILPEGAKILSQAAINEWVEKARATNPPPIQIASFRRVVIAPIRKVEVGALHSTDNAEV